MNEFRKGYWKIRYQRGVTNMNQITIEAEISPELYAALTRIGHRDRKSFAVLVPYVLATYALLNDDEYKRKSITFRKW